MGSIGVAKGIPKYVMVRDNLRHRIEAMATGEQLASEPDLCDQYKVSRITLRHAIDDLIHDGLLVRKQGLGTFRTSASAVSESETLSSHIRGFYRQQQELGNTVHSKVLANEVVVDAGIAKKLGLSDDDELIRLERLRYVGASLKQHVVTYLSAARFPKVLEQDFSNGSLYAFLEQKYAIKLVENTVVVRICNIEDGMARTFGVRNGTPVLEMESTVVDEFGSVIAFGVAKQMQDQNGIKFIIRSQDE